MKLSENWLREWVNPDLDTKSLTDLLTMAGLEVDATEKLIPLDKKIVIGRIEEVEPHPNADRLRVCQVSIEKKKLLQIVCGASNAAEGLKVPVAQVGATLPAGQKIKQAELRGISSSGMLCSGLELGLEESSDGLMVFANNAPIGISVNDYLKLDDTTIETDLTPNRGDCLSVAGIAREVSALSGAKLKPFVVKNVPNKSKRKITVTLSAKQECPHYIGRVIENVNPLAETPLWMKERLRRSGLRSHSPVVDVTNYVLLELGQPMHAFDLDKLSGGIKVVKAKSRHKFTLLDGNSVTVEPNTLLITDNKQPLAIAGIMGGQSSAVSDMTKNIFLESAFFSQKAIAGKARSMGLHTDSSHRFERGVDPALQRIAIERATQLLIDIVGGEPGPIVEQKISQYLPKRSSVILRYARLEQILGLKLANSRVQTLLKRLGMSVTASPKGLRIRPPSYRFDIEREVDLIEEVIRVHGYHNIPEHAPKVGLHGIAVPETTVSDKQLRWAMINRDYQEVITYSFVDRQLELALNPAAEPIALANPISADLSVMRTSLWPGLLQAILYNQNRQQNRMRFFEIGRCFMKKGRDDVDEVRSIAGAVTGPAKPKQWGETSRPADFFDVKADVEALLIPAGRGAKIRFKPCQHPALHPGQAAEIHDHRGLIGILGSLHPEIQAKLGLDQPVVLFELAISSLQAAKIPEFRPISRYPAIRRDVAVIVDRRVPAADVEQVTAEAAGELLVKLELFDDYRGEGIDSGRKSLALGLTLQDSSRTLKEVEVEKIMDHVVTALNKKLGAELR